MDGRHGERGRQDLYLVLGGSFETATPSGWREARPLHCVSQTGYCFYCRDDKKRCNGSVSTAVEPESGRLSLADLILINDDLQVMCSRVTTEGRSTLDKVLLQMELLAKHAGPRIELAREADELCCQARRKLESEWLEMESKMADMSNRMLRTVNVFASKAEFRIRKYELQIQELVDRNRVSAGRNRSDKG